MQRQVGLLDQEPKDKEAIPDPGPSHALREQLEPVLSKIYPLNQVPRIVEADIAMEGGHNYEVQAGVAAIVRFASGLSREEQVKAVVMGVAEADAWAFRKNARRDYADLVHRVHRGFGEDQKDAILEAYAHLRLLEFFNSPEAAAAIDALPADLKGPVQQMASDYTGNKQRVWDNWMAVKMYARRVVAGDEPFRSVLRGIKQELGKEEPPPRTWDDAMDAPFKAWAAQIRENEELLTKITNMRELRDREEYLNDTHSIWAIKGSPAIPDKAANIPIDKSMGFGVMREDLGGGYNELTFVFSKGLSGGALKKAFLQSVIYAHLLHDFQMLSTAGSDFAQRDEDNVIDSRTAVVPDKYDPIYAKCGSEAAVNTLVAHYGGTYSVLSGLSGSKNSDAILDKAHKCVIEGARGDIHVPEKGDDKDVEGPAPGSRLALYQMLARYENIDVNIAKMDADVKTEEDDVIEDAEAVLKRIKAKENEGKGIK
jgi:hypothetical protein